MVELEATREEYDLLVAAISGMSTQLPILSATCVLRLGCYLKLTLPRVSQATSSSDWPISSKVAKNEIWFLLQLSEAAIAPLL